MIRVNIVCIGKVKENFYRDAIAEYSKRLTRFCKLTIIELGECMLSGKSNAEIEKVKDTESKAILAKAKGTLISLDLAGKMMTSPDIAETISKCEISGASELSFIIGGSYGLSDQVKQKCDISMCFGKVTYPHQLMRVILTEQIYRAFMISSNSEYHK